MAGLSAGDARYRNDVGTADPAVAAALTAWAAGTGTEHAVLVALAGSRLLVPVVAMQSDADGAASTAGTDRQGPGEAGRSGAVPAGGLPGEKHSQMATPSLVGRDGRPALMAFTCADAVRRWQADARPVPVAAVAVCQAAAADGAAVVIDVAGPVPVTVEGVRLAALAAGGQVPDMHEDPDAWRLVAAAAGEVAPGIRVRLCPPRGGAEVTVVLAPPPGIGRPVSAEVAERVAEAVQRRLADRARSGIAVVRQPG